MHTYQFTAHLEGLQVLSDDDVDRLCEAGCSDATPFSCDGAAMLGFSRAAESLEAAIRSAIADVAQAGHRVQRIELESDDLEDLACAAPVQTA